MQNEGIKLVIIKGAGEKAFCSGGDIRAITQVSYIILGQRS